MRNRRDQDGEGDDLAVNAGFLLRLGRPRSFLFDAPFASVALWVLLGSEDQNPGLSRVERDSPE